MTEEMADASERMERLRLDGEMALARLRHETWREVLRNFDTGMYLLTGLIGVAVGAMGASLVVLAVVAPAPPMLRPEVPLGDSAGPVTLLVVDDRNTGVYRMDEDTLGIVVDGRPVARVRAPMGTAVENGCGR